MTTRREVSGEDARDGYDPMRAICAAGGWPFCEKHKKPNRVGGCFHLHIRAEQHVYWCEWPDRDCICPPLEGVNKPSHSDHAKAYPSVPFGGDDRPVTP